MLETLGLLFVLKVARKFVFLHVENRFLFLNIKYFTL